MHTLEEIIEGCKKGKQSAQKLLFERYAEQMYGVCLFLTRNNVEAEDILHDGFIRVFENIGKYREGNFDAWMKKVFVNLVLMQFRKNKNMYLLEDISEVSEVRSMDFFEHPMHCYELLEQIRKLPPQYQMVFNLYAIQGYKHKEIADILKIDEVTSRSNLNRARKILQSKLKEFSVADEGR